ncbi:hypothetical protein ACOMHN_019400 [Nucella lapillus]
MSCWGFVKAYRGLLIIFLTPLLLLPLPLIINTPQGKAAFVLILMAVYWVTEVVPIAVTALMPVFVFPMMGIASADETSRYYMKDLLMLFLGGLLMAVSIEKWNLHRRIALRILLVVGSEPRWLMLGLMLATWFLSMWMSNTATTAMMVPITNAILDQLKDTFLDNTSVEMGTVNGNVGEKQGEGVDGGGDKPQATGPAYTAPEDPKTEDSAAVKQYKWMCKGMLLAICYAANSGGIATITGTGTNLALKNFADELYLDHNLPSPVNFATWMGFGILLSLIVLLVCWVWLQIFFLRCKGLTQCCRKSEETRTQGLRVKAIIRQEYRKLGPVSFAERAVLVFFALLVLLWITQDLGGVGGWGDIFGQQMVSDSTPAVFIGFCLFFFPSRNPFRRQIRTVQRYGEGGQDMELIQEESKYMPLLTWSDAHEKVPWSLFFLLGGGFALSKGCEVSGLSYWMGEQLEVFSEINKVAMLLLLCYITAAMTEVTSNTAISLLLLPILRDLALRTGVHPLYYMIPAALACSFAFMLPVATPPNAIVFATGHIRVIDMMSAGFMMNIVAVPLLVMATISWGDAIFDFSHIPPEFLLNTTAVTTAASPAS